MNNCFYQSFYLHPSYLLFAVTSAVCIKFRITDVEVLRIESILQEPEGFAESLEMYNLALSQEADGIADFGIFDQAENVIVCGAGFLFCRHILEEIGDQVTFALELAGIEGNTAGRLWPDAYGVIHIVSFETAVFNLLHREVFGELMYNCRYHFQMRQFFGTDIGIEIAHLKSCVKWAHHRKMQCLNDCNL